MRLLVALQYYAPHRTGYTLHVQRIAEALAARGHAVTVLTARHLPSLPERERLAGVDVVRLPAPIRVSRGAVMPSYAWHALRLAAGADAIWASSPMLEMAFWGALARLRRKRFVITHHGDLHLPAGAFNRFIETFTRANYALGARSAHAIVAYSDDYARHSRYLATRRAKVLSILPPIVAPAPDLGAARAMRDEWGPDGAPVIGFAGRFVQEKRPDLLLRAAIALRDRYPGLRVVFAGEHRIAYETTWHACAELVREAGDAARFLGLIDDAQALANFYAACDVLALPSDSECFALVQAEAMLCGTPVVASDIPGARVPVGLTGMGKLFRPGDVDALVEALAEVIDQRARFVVPRERIAQAFSLSRTVDAYEAVLAAA